MSPTLRSSRDFGALVRDRRKRRGLSQQALADAIGASRWWVNEFERGKPRAELSLVLRALETLGVRLQAEDDDALGTAEIDAIVDEARGNRNG
jgi:HTH-type transcriptional regulator/antitoxin HipB